MGHRKGDHLNERRIIPYGKQLIEDDDIQAVVEALRGDWLTQGPGVQRFEEALAQYCGAKHAVAVANGTIALHLACLAAGVGPGDEGVTTPITFLASANCLLYVGAKPVFADIDPATWNIDPAEIEKKITEKTKVLIPVHFGGLPCDMKEIREIADRHGLTIIEDACHAIGGEYKGKRVGGTGTAEMTCLSFHPVKHMTTGEGGAVLTDDEALAEKLKRLRHHGVTRDPQLMSKNDGPWYHEAVEVGYNGRITDIQCALGLSQLGKLDRFLARRREIAKRYHEEFAGIEGLSMQPISKDRLNAYHLFVVHFDPDRYDRLAIFEHLRKEGIAPQVHYIPVHKQPAMRQAAGEAGELPNAERYYQGCLSLPMFPSLSDVEQGRVISSLRSAT